MNTYNGHKNRNHWNVALWLFNDEPTYRTMVNVMEDSPSRDAAATRLVSTFLPDRTPDGVPYTFASVRAALVGWEA